MGGIICSTSELLGVVGYTVKFVRTSCYYVNMTDNLRIHAKGTAVVDTLNPDNQLKIKLLERRLHLFGEGAVVPKIGQYDNIKNSELVLSCARIYSNLRNAEEIGEFIQIPQFMAFTEIIRDVFAPVDDISDNEEDSLLLF